MHIIYWVWYVRFCFSLLADSGDKKSTIVDSPWELLSPKSVPTMDADTNDSVPGMGDGLNGDTKHDTSTLIQAAIINKVFGNLSTDEIFVEVSSSVKIFAGCFLFGQL